MSAKHKYQFFSSVNRSLYIRVVKKTRFWGNQLLFDFLNLYVEKNTLAKAVACTMLFNIASTITNLSLNS